MHTVNLVLQGIEVEGMFGPCSVLWFVYVVFLNCDSATQLQAATRSCGMTMSGETDGVSRRAALGAFFAGAAAIPGESVCVELCAYLCNFVKAVEFCYEERIWANFDSLFPSCRQCRGHALIRQEQGERPQQAAPYWWSWHDFSAGHRPDWHPHIRLQEGRSWQLQSRPVLPPRGHEPGQRLSLPHFCLLPVAPCAIYFCSRAARHPKFPALGHPFLSVSGPRSCEPLAMCLQK